MTSLSARLPDCLHPHPACADMPRPSLRLLIPETGDGAAAGPPPKHCRFARACGQHTVQLRTAFKRRLERADGAPRTRMRGTPHTAQRRRARADACGRCAPPLRARQALRVPRMPSGEISTAAHCALRALARTRSIVRRCSLLFYIPAASLVCIFCLYRNHSGDGLHTPTKRVVHDKTSLTLERAAGGCCDERA